jgi:16S rRNA A1518/A1519 N6-dimethyltransferase RsmA/KsgA/DIM1 with predicted DNA glycosylase/AP lyase activity
MNRLHRWYCRQAPGKRNLALKDVELEDDVLEIGPGPGLTTDWLRDRCSRLSCLEVDQDLASSLKERTAGSNIHVECGDATEMPHADGLFSTVVLFTVLHHVPSAPAPTLLPQKANTHFRLVGV